MLEAEDSVEGARRDAVDYAMNSDVDWARQIIQDALPGTPDIFQGLFKQAQDDKVVHKDLRVLRGRLTELVDRQDSPEMVEEKFFLLLHIGMIPRFRWVRDIVREFAYRPTSSHRMAALQVLATNEPSAEMVLRDLEGVERKQAETRRAIDSLRTS